MTLQLRDLFALADLAEAIDAGHIRQQEHPSLPLRIMNYTERAAFESAWTPVTRQCRGLIVDDTDRVLARPFPKFFNWGQPEAPALDLDAPALVTDKADGSLGILYPTPDGHEIATRGSFTSPQALHASRVWRERYAARVTVPDGITPLFEIVFPENRIVLDYDGLDDLILLGGVGIATGEIFAPHDFACWWTGPQTQVFPACTLREALEMPPRENAEGLVVRVLKTGEMVKIKQEDYLILHRIITGLNARGIWEHLGNGGTIEEICEPLPDEFHPWARSVAAGLVAERQKILTEARTEHARILSLMATGWTRKDYAAHAVQSPLRAWLFMLLDDRDPADKIWQTLRPSAELRPVNYSEDVA